MKKITFLLLIIVVLFSVTATAQHYVKVSSPTKSLKGIPYNEGHIFPIEIDSANAYYIHIEKQHTNLTYQKGGVLNGAIFKITQYNTNIKQVHFNDNDGTDRNGAFMNAKIVIKVADSIFVPLNDIKFLDATVVKQKTDSIKTIIENSCIYNPTKYVLDCTKSMYQYIYKGKERNPDKLVDVKNNEKITFLTETEEIPNIIFKAFELAKYEQNNAKSNAFNVEWLKEYWWLIMLGVILILLMIWGVIWIIKHPRLHKTLQSKKKCKRQAKSNMDSSTLIAPAKPINVEGQVVYDERLYKKHDKIEGIVISIEDKTKLIESKSKSIKEALEEQKKVLNDIKSLVSNSDDKKQLLEKTRELESKAQELSDAKTKIQGLEEEVNILKKKTDIKGVVQVLDCAKFVNFAKNIMAECINAENQIYQYWSTLTDADQQKLNFFLGKIQLAKTKVNFAKWNGLIATLEVDGYVKDEDYVKYLTNLSNKDKIVFLEKRFFEDILRPYVGSVVLFMEQIRTIQKLGVKEVFKEGNLEGMINSICTKCFEQGVIIDYRKLYEKVTEYDSLEIEENIPKAIQKAISNIDEEDVLLYVDKFAVNLKSGELMEKTRCVVKI